MASTLDDKDLKKRVCLVNPTIIIRRPVREKSPLLIKKGYFVGLLRPIRKKRLDHHLKAYVDHLAKELGVVLKDEAVVDKALSNGELLKGLRLHHYRALWAPGQFEWPIPLLSFWKESFRVLKNYDVVKVWSNFYLNNFLLFLLSYFFPRTRMILVLDTIPGYSFKSSRIIDFLLRAYTKSLCKLMFWRADKIVLYGESLRPFAEKAGLPMNKIVVIPTGLHPYERPPEARARRFLTKKLGLSEKELSSKKVVSFIGLLNDRKGVDLLLKVAERLSRERSDFIIVVAGSGPKKSSYERFVEEKGLSSVVKIIGYCDHKELLLEASDIFFFPSRGEGLAGVLMEAMHHEKPILTTKIPCTTDLIIDGEEGLLVDVDDEEALFKKLSLLLDDADLRKRLGKKAGKKIRSFNWDRVIKKYEGVYE